MQVMIDHITAVVIGASVLFLVAALMLRGQDSTIEAAQVDAAKGGLRLLVDMVEQDLNNIGSGMPNPNETEAAVTKLGVEGSYTVLRFTALTTPTSSTPATITYRWKQDGQAQLSNGTTVNTFLVERLVDGTVEGESFNNVTTFNVSLMGADPVSGHPIAFDPATGDYSDVRYVNVDVAMVSPLGTDGLIEQTRWSKQFRPINLDSDSRTLIRVVTL